MRQGMGENMKIAIIAASLLLMMISSAVAEKEPITNQFTSKRT
jgi:hypothetical protein